AEPLFGIELGAALDQDRDDLQVAVDRGIMHRGPCRFVGLVRIAALADQRPDELRIVLFRRARHIVVILAERVDLKLRARRGLPTMAAATVAARIATRRAFMETPFHRTTGAPR